MWCVIFERWKSGLCLHFDWAIAPPRFFLFHPFCCKIAFTTEWLQSPINFTCQTDGLIFVPRKRWHIEWPCITILHSWFVLVYQFMPNVVLCILVKQFSSLSTGPSSRSFIVSSDETLQTWVGLPFSFREKKLSPDKFFKHTTAVQSFF